VALDLKSSGSQLFQVSRAIVHIVDLATQAAMKMVVVV
jgi:hypothetical protein